jgi:phage shock protein PspC (stress-responsive transcriptional regulator)
VIPPSTQIGDTSFVTGDLLIDDPMDQGPEPPRQPEAAAPPAGGTTAARGRLVRRTDNKVIAGVASGIADALEIQPILVRIAFVVLTAAGGLGVWLYVLGWLVLPPHRPRLIQLAVLWVLALLWAAAIAGDSLSRLFEDFVRRLWETRWAWPLAAAVAVTVLTSPPARRRWPTPTRRVQLGLIVVAGLGGLTAALGPHQALLLLGLAAVVGLLAAWVLVLPRQLAPPLPTQTLDTLEARDRLALSDARLKLQNDLRTTALQAIGGLAVLAGAVLAFQQLTDDRKQATATQELTRQGQASERFTRAVDQLGSDRPEVRLGGIYGLEQIAQQAPDNRLAVTEVLVAYLHRASPRPANPTPQPAESLRDRAPEVQAALTVLVRRRPLFNDPRLDLIELDLRGAEVSGQTVLVNNRFGLREGDLRGADLRGTDLRDARFFGVYLYEADFRRADLRGADFQQVNPPGNDASDDSYPGQLPPLDPLDAGIESADFRGTLVDSSTKWWLDRPPEGVRTL